MKQITFLVDDDVEKIEIFDIVQVFPEINANPYCDGFIEKHLCEFNIIRSSNNHRIRCINTEAIPQKINLNDFNHPELFKKEKKKNGL